MVSAKNWFLPYGVGWGWSESVYKSDFFSPKIGEKSQNPFRAIMRQKKKWQGPLSH